MARPDLNDYFIQMAGLVSTRSSWPGTKVGCVLTKNGMVVSTGYNGTPRGWFNEMPKTQESKKYYCHAEENAIAQAARMGARTEDCVAYVTVSPCLTCARMMVNAGVRAVYYGARWDEYEGNLALDMLTQLGVQVTPKW